MKNEDPVRFIEHQGQQVLLIDFSNADAHKMMLLLEDVRTTVAEHPRGSLLTLADFTGATIDHAVAMKIKEVLTLDRPFVKNGAWVGAEHIPHAFMENFHSFSQREIVTFKTREEALNWLVKS